MKQLCSLNNFLTEYNEKNIDNRYRPVAVGRYGIRTRESIYSKELAKDYSKNKLIYKNTLTVGMGSVQIDIGILTDDVVFSVSPAYHTYKVTGINSEYLRYCLECRNQDMFVRYVKRGSRQGKTIDLKRWLTYEIPVYDDDMQAEIVDKLDRVASLINNHQQQLQKLDELVKSRFIELFGNPVTNSAEREQVTIGEACTLINGRAFKPTEWSREGLPIVRIQNLNDINAPFNYFDGKVNDQHLINSGMLLFSWSGTPGTSFGAFMWNRGLGVLNQHIFKVIPKLDFDLDYLRYAINGQLTAIIAKAHGGVGLQHITKAELEKIVLLQPSMQEQKQFAAFVAEVDKSKLCGKMEVAA